MRCDMRVGSVKILLFVSLIFLIVSPNLFAKKNGIEQVWEDFDVDPQDLSLEEDEIDEKLIEMTDTFKGELSYEIVQAPNGNGTFLYKTQENGKNRKVLNINSKGNFVFYPESGSPLTINLSKNPGSNCAFDEDAVEEMCVKYRGKSKKISLIGWAGEGASFVVRASGTLAYNATATIGSAVVYAAAFGIVFLAKDLIVSGVTGTVGLTANVIRSVANLATASMVGNSTGGAFGAVLGSLASYFVDNGYYTGYVIPVATAAGTFLFQVYVSSKKLAI
jgi:hypothetical protein